MWSLTINLSVGISNKFLSTEFTYFYNFHKILLLLYDLYQTLLNYTLTPYNIQVPYLHINKFMKGELLCSHRCIWVNLPSVHSDMCRLRS